MNGFTTSQKIFLSETVSFCFNCEFVALNNTVTTSISSVLALICPMVPLFNPPLFVPYQANVKIVKRAKNCFENSFYLILYNNVSLLKYLGQTHHFATKSEFLGSMLYLLNQKLWRNTNFQQAQSFWLWALLYGNHSPRSSSKRVGQAKTSNLNFATQASFCFTSFAISYPPLGWITNMVTYACLWHLN